MKKLLFNLSVAIIAVLAAVSISHAQTYITSQLTNNAYDDDYPEINASGSVVWYAYDGTDNEIFLYDGSTVTQLTSNAYNDHYPRINASGSVVWQEYDGTDDEIFLYDGSTVTQLTSNAYNDYNPRINANGSVVVWEGYDGTDYEIFLAIPLSGLAVSRGPAAGLSRVNDYGGCGPFNAFGAGLNPEGAVRVAKGDVTGDGVPELLVGTYGGSITTPAGSMVRVFSGSCALVGSFRVFGAGINPTGNIDVGVGDLDFDGINEIIVGAGEGGDSRVRIFDDAGAGYSLLASFRAFGPGLNPSGAVFVDGGRTSGTLGIGQIAVGTGSRNSRVRIFDYNGQQRPAIYNTINAFGRTNPSGMVDVAMGDFDGDGVDEIIAGTGNGGNSRVKIFDENGVLLDFFAAFGSGLNPTGLINVSSGDIDQDGIDEIIAGTGGDSGAPGTSRVRMFNFRNSIYFRLAAFGPSVNPSGYVDVAGVK